MSAYYNEIDPAAAQWLRNLIEAGHIAPGDVDERSIEDVTPGDLAGYTQCHFFAGIGVWSYALRRAGWPDDRPVWTGSCPCQPFSSAGAQAGFDDERHLWPHFHWLIEQCRPAVVFGEQVASKAVEPWIDLVQTDLEGLGYAFAGIPFPSAGVGAPHIRDRLFWVGHTDEPGSQGHAGHGGAEGWQGSSGSAATAGILGGLAHPNSEQHDRSRIIGPSGRSQHSDGGATAGGEPTTGPVNGFWGTADWLHCRDGKWRPVEPWTFPLAHGLARSMGSLQPELRRLAELAGLDGKSLERAKRNRIVRLQGYGNAINAEAAREFIGSVMECIG